MPNQTCRCCGTQITGDKRRSYCSKECRDKGPASKRLLRVVEPDEMPTEQASVPGVKEATEKQVGALEYRVLTVDVAAREGTQLEKLVAMQIRVADAVADKSCSPRDLAALTRRLQELDRSIEALRLELKEEADDGEATPDEAWDEEAI